MVGMLVSRTSRAFSKRARERSRVAAHIARAEKFASESAATLDPLRALVRELLLRALSEYREEGIFPENHRTGCHTPVFVDEKGTRCAVGHLLALSGESELVRKIAAERNLATVHQLADEPRLVQWLDAAGISLTEAALIQPGYAPTCSTAAQCFCAPYRIRGARQTRDEGDGGVQTTAVLDCTVIEQYTARIDRIYGSTQGHSVGDTIRVSVPTPTDHGRVLVPVEANGGQPVAWDNLDAGGPFYLAIPVSPDGTATCTAVGWGSVDTHAQATTAISALISADCAATFVSLDRSGDDRRCNRACSVASPASNGPASSPSISILLSLVGALVVRRARRGQRPRSVAQPASPSSIAKSSSRVAT
jgi:hypothetical protein